MKKAEMTWIVAIIIFLAVLLVLFPIVYKIQAATKKSVEKGICRASVEKLAAGKEIPLVGQQITGAKIDCPRERLTFKKGESQDKMNEKLVKAIEQCVWNFEEGKKDFTQNEFLSTFTHCAICAEIDFEEGASFDASKYYDWIAKTNMLGAGKTYAVYFEDLPRLYEPNNFVNYLIKPEVMDDPKQEYYLFFEAKQYSSDFTTIFGLIEGGGQSSKFKLEPIDTALKNCENLLN